LHVDNTHAKLHQLQKSGTQIDRPIYGFVYRGRDIEKRDSQGEKDERGSVRDYRKINKEILMKERNTSIVAERKRQKKAVNGTTKRIEVCGC
jgi:hypothetical protein